MRRAPHPSVTGLAVSPLPRLLGIFCLLGLVIVAGPASVAGGALDSSFSGDGKVSVDVGSGEEEGQAVAIQEDGKVVLAGQVRDTDEDVPYSIGLVRLNSDGSVDTAFGNQGTVTTGFGSAQDVAVQPDGKIVVAGSHVSGCCDTMFLVARFNNDGSLDDTFSDDGIQTANFGSRGDVGWGLALQDDGKVVVVGWTDLGETVVPRFVVLRFNTDGSPDTSFDGDGAQVVDFGRQAEARSVAIQSDGKIVVAGSQSARGDFALARLSSTGALDGTFSGDGRKTIDFGRSSDRGNDVAIQPNGRIVVAGEVGRPSGWNFGVARVTTSGALDTSFSRDGKSETNFFGLNDHGQGVQLQADGKIVVVGWADPPRGDTRVAIARYKRRGKLDLTFSGDGRQATRFGRQAWGNDVAIQSDGKILAVGAGSTRLGAFVFFAARYLAN